MSKEGLFSLLLVALQFVGTIILQLVGMIKGYSTAIIILTVILIVTIITTIIIVILMFILKKEPNTIIGAKTKVAEDNNPKPYEIINKWVLSEYLGGKTKISNVNIIKAVEDNVSIYEIGGSYSKKDIIKTKTFLHPSSNLLDKRKRCSVI